jgi:lysyl-tRNA synthetase class 2
MRLFLCIQMVVKVRGDFLMTQQLNWQPSADIETLKGRAIVMQRIREYFSNTQALEVETPVLSHYTGTDVQLMQWQTKEGLSLHTSPEFAMKRLLAAGAGDIFQICKVFRKDESGKKHNPEFTMLEWYRLECDEFALMKDLTDLIEFVSGNESLNVQTLSYSQAFTDVGLPEPHLCSLESLQTAVADCLMAKAENWSKDDCLDALMSMVVEPSLDAHSLVFVHDFPASQAALAEHKSQGGVQVARRFELFWKGMELANGYFELTDPVEQQLRFEKDSAQRKRMGLEETVQDENFLAALKAGLPTCSGVALGLDRLLMVLLGKQSIEEVVSFSFDRA